MYRGFNLKTFSLAPIKESFLLIGLELYNNQKLAYRDSLQKFIQSDGIIDGSAIQQEWFPQNRYDIFISHSHSDKDFALILAGMFKTVGLTSFIDSSIWGHCDDLLKMIDDKYCYKPKSHTFDYKLRNATTSHIHMMLSNALTNMIDLCECLFFINSQHSIKVDSVINKTLSPWIYSELATSRIIRKVPPTRQINKSETKVFNKINENLAIDYEVDLSHLIDLTHKDLIKWIKILKENTHPLDILYSILPLKQTEK